MTKGMSTYGNTVLTCQVPGQYRSRKRGMTRIVTDGKKEGTVQAISPC